MKHLFIGIGILLLCLALCLTVNAILGRYTQHVEELLVQSLEAAQGDDWEAADAALSQARDFWNHHRGFWGVALRHAEVDTVDSFFAQLTVHVQSGSDDFASTCADLLRQIRHLCRSEQPAYYNILAAAKPALRIV